MVIDLKRCIGCYGCQIFCKTENATPPGILWSRVLFYESGNYPTVRKMPLPVLCMHCEAPTCVDVCPTGAGIKRPDGIVTIDSDKCTGCLNCLIACPYGARSFNWRNPRPYIDEINPDFPTRTRGVVEKCNFCAERLAQGLLPACVEACPEKALVFGNLEDPESELREIIRSEHIIQRLPELGTKPNIYYVV